MLGRRHLHSAIRTAPLPALLALLLIVPASAAAQERTVTVNGTATQRIVNDSASLGISVSKDRRTRRAALRAVATRLRAVIAAVQTFAGVGPGDVTTGLVSVQRLSRPKPYYRASEGITVILHDASRAGELITAAISAGATGTRGPNFFPADPDLAFTTALIAAFDQARAKASALAARAGAILGPVVSIEEGAQFTSAPAEARRRSPRGPQASPPARPGSSTVNATVHVVFALE